MGESDLVIKDAFGIDEITVKKTLTSIIEKIPTPDKVVQASREAMSRFGWITKDNNPIHKFSEQAIEYGGFTDTPVMGAHLAAYGEQFTEKVIHDLNKETWGSKIKLIGQTTKFKDPVYPEEKLTWEVGRYNVKNRNGQDIIDISINGSINREENSKIAVSINARLGNEYGIMPQIAGPGFWRKFAIQPKHLDVFYRCVGASPNSKIPQMFPGAFIPATLLELLETTTQSLEGVNREIDINFLNEPRMGSPVRVDMFQLLEEPKAIRGTDQKMYDIRFVCSQDTKPLSYGIATALTKHNLII